jgi:UDP-N-acetylglucosamine transferase subunit ALG13
LVTVGTQLPFDRLIRWMDAAADIVDDEIVAQSGTGTYQARRFNAQPWIAPGDFDRLVSSARLIVSHAGIGSVLAAQRHGRPIVLVPRLASLKEHRNDHQRATVCALRDRPGIYIAEDENRLREILSSPVAAAAEAYAGEADRARLRNSIADFIQGSGKVTAA